MPSPLDPDTEAGLQRLLQAETRRVNQQNFGWTFAWLFIVILWGGLGLGFLFILALDYCHPSYSSATPYTPIDNGNPIFGVGTFFAVAIGLPLVVLGFCRFVTSREEKQRSGK